MSYLNIHFYRVEDDPDSIDDMMESLICVPKPPITDASDSVSFLFTYHMFKPDEDDDIILGVIAGYPIDEYFKNLREITSEVPQQMVDTLTLIYRANCISYAINTRNIDQISSYLLGKFPSGKWSDSVGLTEALIDAADKERAWYEELMETEDA